MAYEEAVQCVTRPAGASLSSDQYKFVVLNSSGDVVLPDSTSLVRPFGVLQNKPDAAGKAATVAISGITKVNAAASTLSVGDFVASSTAGVAVGLSTGFIRVGRIVGGSSGGAGRILSVLLQPWGTT